VVDWRARYDAGGVTALHDQPRSGRPPEIDEIDEVDVVVATLADEGRPPARLGITHWSARLLGAENQEIDTSQAISDFQALAPAGAAASGSPAGR
jgi:hypothetical protein